MERSHPLNYQMADQERAPVYPAHQQLVNPMVQTMIQPVISEDPSTNSTTDEGGGVEMALFMGKVERLRRIHSVLGEIRKCLLNYGGKYELSLEEHVNMVLKCRYSYHMNGSMASETDELQEKENLIFQ